MNLTVYLPLKFKTIVAHKLYRLSRLRGFSISCLAESIINEYLDTIDIPDSNKDNTITEVKLRYVVGERIATFRQLNYLSQQKLGEMVGLDQQKVSLLETGRRRLDIVEAVAIAQALGVTIQDFLE